MNREIKITSDGSPTVYSEKWEQHYHSVHGAFKESMHVFISHGLNATETPTPRILEIGMGTGINVYLTWKNRGTRSISMDTIEAYPLSVEEWTGIEVSNESAGQTVFDRIHQSQWEKPFQLDTDFELRKIHSKLEEWSPEAMAYDLIYFDAFAPSTQPELWSVEIFRKCYEALRPSGILVTYCAKGQVKRNMKEAGFTIEALPGPPMKREMTRAKKG